MTAADVDTVLHRERLARPRPMAHARDLPDGAMAAADGQAWLKRGDRLRLWTPAGYGEARALPPGPVEVLTPAATLAAFRAGYATQIHPSAGCGPAEQ